MLVQNKNFLLPEYEKEEQYLRDMALKGYELVDIKPVVYTVKYCFEENSSTNYVYRLDFYTDKDEASYIQMYEDYGWIYITKLNNFYYFKKDGSEADLEIFSDDESRYEMARNVIKSKLLPVLLIVLCSGGLFIQLVDSLNVFVIVWAILLVLDLYLTVRCTIGFIRLEKKYGEHKNG